MTFTPLTGMPLYLQLHVAAALLSVVLGPFVLLRTRRDRVHRVGGYVWSVAMGIVAVSSFWIREFAVVGPFSPIHLLSVLTLWSLWTGIRHAIARRIEAHRIVFRNLYWYGLLVAGTFNFLPGRRMNAVLFPEAPDLGLWLIASVGMTVAVWHGARLLARWLPRLIDILRGRARAGNIMIVRGRARAGIGKG